MSRLRWNGPTPDDLAATFAREGKLVGKRALRHMRRVTKVVMETSKSYAPVDYKGTSRNSMPLHELEKSHRVVEYPGVNRRIEARVEVGGMVGTVNVDLYARWIHDGSYELGPASRAKGPQVGPKYLERALEKHKADLDIILDELVEGLLL